MAADDPLQRRLRLLRREAGVPVPTVRPSVIPVGTPVGATPVEADGVSPGGSRGNGTGASPADLREGESVAEGHPHLSAERPGHGTAVARGEQMPAQELVRGARHALGLPRPGERVPEPSRPLSRGRLKP